MFKLCVFLVITAIISCNAEPDPKAGVLAAATLAVGPAVVTATSSQSFVRGFPAPLVAAPYVASPYVAAPYVASPYYSAPIVAAF